MIDKPSATITEAEAQLYDRQVLEIELFRCHSLSQNLCILLFWALGEDTHEIFQIMQNIHERLFTKGVLAHILHRSSDFGRFWRTV